VAHLTRALAPPACALLLAACQTGDVTSRVVTVVFDQAVVCEAADRCVSPWSGAPVTGERYDVVGIVSSGASRYDPGLYAYAGGFRRSGVFFELELDVPAQIGAEVRELAASYREYAGGSPLFASWRATGSLQTVPLAGSGGPYAGAFDLAFTDPGPDGALGTDDDRVRMLRYGWFTLTGIEPESPERPFEVRDDGVWVDVGVDVYYDDPAWDYSNDGCGGDTTEGYEEGSGCEGDTSTDPGGGEGCEGDTSTDPGGGGGCEGDTGSDYGGGGGCEGDTGSGAGGGGCGGDAGGGAGGCGGSGGGGGCAGDATAQTQARRRTRPARVLNASLPLLALLLACAVLRRR
jgi:hypothetical protein